MSQMHLNGLANVCIDNPTKCTKEQLVDSVLNFLDTDTILFFSDVRISFSSKMSFPC
jgi:chaperone required for assembly of F1-ATPase